MAESSAGSSFDCLICSESFKVNDDLVDHLCEHLSYRKYRCGSCDKTFITERKQKKHCEKNSHFRVYQVTHNQPNGSKSLGILEVVAFVNGRRRKIRQVAAMVECCFPCPIPLHASKSTLRQLIIDAFGKSQQDDESEVDIPTTTSSNKPLKSVKRRRARPDEFTDRFTVVERLPLAMRTITPEDRARMMAFAPMKRRFPSSSESESDDEEETTETAQGVVANNDEDGKLVKTNGTAAKVSKIEISSSDSDDSDADESHNDRTPVVEAKKNRRTAGRSSVGS